MKKQQILKINLSKLSKKSKAKILDALKSAYDEVTPKFVDYSLKVNELEGNLEEQQRLYDKNKTIIDENYELVRLLDVFGIDVTF